MLHFLSKNLRFGSVFPRFFDEIFILLRLGTPTRSKKSRLAKTLQKPSKTYMFHTILAYPHFRARSKKLRKSIPKCIRNVIEKAMHSGSEFSLICLALGTLLGTFWHPDGSPKPPKTPQVTPKIPQRVPKRPQRLPKRLPKSA